MKEVKYELPTSNLDTVAKIRHVAVAVDSIEASLPIWKVFGVNLIHEEDIESEKVRTAHLELEGGNIELLEPLESDSLVSGFLERRGGGLHHIAIEVENIDEIIEKGLEIGLKPIGEAPRKGAENCLVAFYHPKDTGGGLIEVVQPTT